MPVATLQSHRNYAKIRKTVSICPQHSCTTRNYGKIASRLQRKHHKSIIDYNTIYRTIQAEVWDKKLSSQHPLQAAALQKIPKSLLYPIAPIVGALIIVLNTCLGLLPEYLRSKPVAEAFLCFWVMQVFRTQNTI